MAPTEVPEASRGRVDQSSIRLANLSMVLRRVTADGPRSRATIAVETGFNKTTVSSLVSELIDLRLLVETGEREQPGSVGRPARTVRLNGDAIAAVGLEVNVDYLAVCVSDLSGQVRYQRRVDADNAMSRPSRVLGRLSRLGQRAITAVEAEGARIVGVAVGVPGLVDVAGGTLVVAPNLGWRDVKVAEWLMRRLGRPGVAVRVDNEANLAALAEHWEGAARDLSTFVCVSGDVGVGAGILVDGELYRGPHGFGGEVGHITVDPDGDRCACGSRGCLETVAGQVAVLRRAGIAIEGSRRGSATRELLARARDGDARTLEALSGAGTAIGVGLAAVVNLLDPEAVLLGGYLTPLAEWLVEPVQAELSGRVLAAAHNGCEVRTASLGAGAASRGAAASVLRAVLADPRRAEAAVA
jgi:predicted NBD/HSP70 family sugar kinase